MQGKETDIGMMVGKHRHVKKTCVGISKGAHKNDEGHKYTCMCWTQEFGDCVKLTMLYDYVYRL